MKKSFWIGSAVICALILGILFLPRQEGSDLVTFYYAQKNYSYGRSGSTMAGERREVGHRGDDLSYLLALYLEGPIDPNLRSPFPGKNVSQVQTLSVRGSTVTITLPDTAVGMRDGEFSLSCACLARTCLEITGLDSVKIISGDRTVTMTMKNLLLEDESVLAEETTEERK